MTIQKTKLSPKATIRTDTHRRMNKFRAHIPIMIRKKNCTVKTADSSEELQAAPQQLNYHD